MLLNFINLSKLPVLTAKRDNILSVIYTQHKLHRLDSGNYAARHQNHYTLKLTTSAYQHFRLFILTVKPALNSLPILKLKIWDTNLCHRYSLRSVPLLFIYFNLIILYCINVHSNAYWTILFHVLSQYE